PPEFPRKLPNPQNWRKAEIIEWSSKLMLNTQALAIGLKEHGLIDDRQFNAIRATRVPRENKSDPELPKSLPPARRIAKIHAMERGLSDYYVGLALDAYKQAAISRGRLCEMLLCDEREVVPMAELFGRTLAHAD